MADFKDKVVLITGAGRGSGRALTEAFAAHEAVVAANDISPVNVEEVVDRIVAAGGNAKAYIDDVAKKVGAQNIINQVEDDFGINDFVESANGTRRERIAVKERTREIHLDIASSSGLAAYVAITASWSFHLTIQPGGADDPKGNAMRSFSRARANPIS